MDVNELTVGDIKTIVAMFGKAMGQNDPCGKTHSFCIGKAYLIRTVTMHYTGRVVAVTESDVLLEDAAWIADTGRFANCLKAGTLSEVEPYPDRAAVSRGAIVDFAEWDHPLPRVQQ